MCFVVCYFLLFVDCCVLFLFGRLSCFFVVFCVGVRSLFDGCCSLFLVVCCLFVLFALVPCLFVVRCVLFVV